MRLTPLPGLFRLTLWSFLLVSLPLVFTIVTAIQKVEQLAEESLRGMMAVEQKTTASRTLAELATSMERSARQYRALEDEQFRTYFLQHRKDALAQVERLSALAGKPPLAAALETAKDRIEEVSRQLQSPESDSADNRLYSALEQMQQAIRTIIAEQSADSKSMAAAFPNSALELRSTLIGQAALVIPVSAGLAVLFGFAIARPIRKIGNAIVSLGRNELGQPVRIRGTADLEQLGQRLDWLRLRLMSLEEQKAQFLRNVSHELKTPLTNIREGADLLASKGLIDDVGERKEVARIVLENSVRLQKMIEELLRYGSVSGVLASKDNTTVQLDQLILELVESHRAQAERRHIALNVDLAPANVLSNAARMQVIVGNLLSNAMKYTPPQGAIDVSLHQDTESTVLDVRDDGPGISEADFPHLFEWFYSGRKPPSSIVAGTGMGLAIAQEYAEQAGGRIECLPVAKGAHFRLTLRSMDP